MNNFIYGFFYPFRSIKLFFRYPKLIAYSIVPMVINLVIYGTIFYYTYSYVTGKSSDLFETQIQNSLILEFIKFFIKIFSFAFVLLICYLAFIIFGGIIAAPFNELISKLIEEGALFSFYYNALDYMDYPMSRRMIKFGQKLHVINSKKTVSMGFGAMAFILTFLPVINVLLNPLLVASGTSLFFIKEFNKQLS